MAPKLEALLLTGHPGDCGDAASRLRTSTDAVLKPGLPERAPVAGGGCWLPLAPQTPWVPNKGAVQKSGLSKLPGATPGSPSLSPRAVCREDLLGTFSNNLPTCVTCVLYSYCNNTSIQNI